MAFENLSEKLQSIFKQMNRKGKLTEKDIKEALREVRLALLEADVNYKIVKEFVSGVTEAAMGSDVLESLTPGQQVIKIVNDRLTDLIGSTQSKLTFSPKPPTVFLMVGLQGAGKTTFTGKLGKIIQKQGKHPLLVACDVYRPAAVKQLQIVGKSINIPVFSMPEGSDPVDIASASIEYALSNRHDVVIIDTAGRLHINDELMAELKNIKGAVRPQEILLVVDAMTGQDAVTVAQSFNDQLGVDGIIVTKYDSDTRGGAALSVKAVTGKPVKYVGTGEKMDDVEPFHPERVASRILGMGDVMSLIEKAQQAYDDKQAAELEKKMRANEFTLDDFLEQLQQVRKMGPIKDLLGMIPGMNKFSPSDLEVDEKVFDHVQAVICSMTPKERANPSIINASRKRRISRGCGRSIQEINRLLKQFEDMKKMMKQFTETGRGKKGKLNIPFFR